MNRYQCPACQGTHITRTHQTVRPDRFDESGWNCWRCGFAWASLNDYPIRADLRSAISYRRTDRYHRLTRGATHA